MNLAPIILFGYDRPAHISNMIESLTKNKESFDSELFIFIDGKNDTTDVGSHKKVIDKVSENLPFKKKYLNFWINGKSITPCLLSKSGSSVLRDFMVSSVFLIIRAIPVSPTNM